MKFLLLTFAVFFLASCSKKKEDDTGSYNPAYQVITVTSGGTIKGIVKTDSSQKFSPVITTQKDQDVCGESHPNPAMPSASGAVPGCVIGIESISSGKDFSKREFTLDQKGCNFQPHIQIVNLRSPVIVSNSDKVLHNYHIYYNGESVMNEAQPEGAPPREALIKEKGLHRISCDVHPWMRGFIWMADHPYYTISDASGAFTISDVPPGKYKLVLWRDNWNMDEVKNASGVIESYKWGTDFSKVQEVTVEAGKEAIVDFTLP
jgi:hypothetical protein